MSGFSLQCVDGETYDLSDCSGPIQIGSFPKVFGPAPLSFETKDSASLNGGAVLTSPRAQARTMTFRVRFLCASALHREERVEAFAASILAGAARLVRDRTDGTTRSTIIQYASGLDLLEVESDDSPRGFADLIWTQPNPYWADLVPQVSRTTFPITGTGLTYTPWNSAQQWSPDIPWNGWQATGVQGQVATGLFSVGTGPTWPRFEITGPFDGLEMVNASGGKRPLIFEGSVLTGETLVIETRDQSRSARVGGVSRVADFNLAESDFWHLVRGQNSITIRAFGAIDTNTSLFLSFIPQYVTC